MSEGEKSISNISTVRMADLYSGKETVSLDDFSSKTMDSKLPGKLGERYQITRVIGSGAFGVVYLAEDRTLGRLVAIKQLFPSKKQKDGFDIYDHFIQEAKIAGQLEHPHIVIVYNIEWVEDGSALIVMEFLGGGSLNDLMKKEPEIDLNFALRIMQGILSGLDAAHQIEVVHRDVKPQNILFGIGTIPKVTDFGLAHLPRSAGGIEETENTKKKKNIMGTPLYMSPEQVLMKKVDRRTDIYSAGAVFYQMLTGKTLFRIPRRSKFSEIQKMILKSEVEPVSKLRKDVPKVLDDIIAGMLAKKPEDRFPDAVSVMKALINAQSKFRFMRKSEKDEFLFHPTSVLINSPAAILEDIIHLLLADEYISHQERAELMRRAERLGMSRTQTRFIEERVRKNLDLPSLSLIEEIFNTMRKYLGRTKTDFSDEEKNIILKKQKEYGISPKEINSIKIDIIKKRDGAVPVTEYNI